MSPSHLPAFETTPFHQSLPWKTAALTAMVLLLASCGSSATTGASEQGAASEQDAASGQDVFAGSRRDPAPLVNTVELPAVAPDRDNEAFSFIADEGDVLLVYFGYTSCPDVCPTTLADVAAARATLGDTGERVDLAMATIDPVRDTAEVLSAYVGGFVPGGTALRTEDDAQLAAAADLFGVYYEVNTGDDGVVEVLHTGTLFGVDDSGTLVASWPFGTTPSDLTNDLEILLKDA